MTDKILFQTNNTTDLYNFLIESFKDENIPKNLNELKEKNILWLFDSKISDLINDVFNAKPTKYLKQQFKTKEELQNYLNTQKLSWLNGSKVKLYKKTSNGGMYLRFERTDRKLAKFKRLDTFLTHLIKDNGLSEFQGLTDEEFNNKVKPLFIMSRRVLEDNKEKYITE